MNQLVILAVSEKITRLDAEVHFSHLDALESFGEAVAGEENVGPHELIEELLGRAGDEEPREGDRCRAQAKYRPLKHTVPTAPLVEVDVSSGRPV